MPSKVSQHSLFLSLLQYTTRTQAPLSFNNTPWYWKREKTETVQEGGESLLREEAIKVVPQALT